MQSNRTPSDPGFSVDPRSVPPRRISHYGNQPKRISQNRESKDSCAESSRPKRKENEEDDSDQEYYNFEKLKKFHIPRKKGQEEKELLSELLLSSREYTHTIFPTVRSSYFDPQACRKLMISNVELVQNPALEKEYLTKKRDMKDEGRSEKDLIESFGYLHFFKRNEVEKICKEGVSVGHCNLSSLGKAEMGVYVCKHADITRFSRWEENQSGFIIMFKIIKGRTKLVMEGRQAQTEQEPTPLYDCHVTKLPIDIAQSVHSRAYQAFQYYIYEYGDVDVLQRPRQVMPYAVLKYTYDDLSGSAIATSRSSRRESSTDEIFSDNGGANLSTVSTSVTESTFCHWRGKLLVKNGTFCSVEMTSHLDTVFNVANIDRSINIKTCLSLDKLKRQLPPTLMSRTAKKHNVIYRGRYYNTFAVHPTEESSGSSKFRQLVGHLVQRSAAAFIPLRNNSTLYLLPLSSLTEEMGLRSSSPESSETGEQIQRAWKNFLHAIIITPKALSSKINDQRVFNIIHTRKRKDSTCNIVLSSVHDVLEQKLRQMNIEPSSALSAMDAEQQQKIYNQLKNKKKLQTSEKMLHGYYKEMDIVSPSAKSKLKKDMTTLWADTANTQQDMYSGNKRLKLIPTQVNPERRPRSISRGSMSQSPQEDAENLMEDITATFSDDDDAPLRLTHVKPSYKIPKKQKMEDPRTVTTITNVPFDSDDIPDAIADTIPDLRDIVTRPFQYTPAPKPTKPTNTVVTSILRPSFKPLEELIFSENIKDLMKHPEFSFTEKHCMSHTVVGYFPPSKNNSPFVTWEEKHSKIAITFTQPVPYPVQKTDCPYAFEMDDLIISMLRAIHGEYDSSSDTPQEQDKVRWVRGVLHSRGANSKEALASVGGTITDAGGMGRKIVEHMEEKTTPQFTEASPHQSSTDSGFVSSSAAGTPGVADSPSLKDIATILASAITKSKTTLPDQLLHKTGTLDGDGTPDMELAAQALLQVLTNSSEKEGVSPGIDISQGRSDDLEGVDMEIGSTPDASPSAQKLDSSVQKKNASEKTPDQSAKSPIKEQHSRNSSHQQQGPASMSENWETAFTPPPLLPDLSDFDVDSSSVSVRRRELECSGKDHSGAFKRSPERIARSHSPNRFPAHGKDSRHQNSEQLEGEWEDGEIAEDNSEWEHNTTPMGIPNYNGKREASQDEYPTRKDEVDYPSLKDRQHSTSRERNDRQQCTSKDHDDRQHSMSRDHAEGQRGTSRDRAEGQRGTSRDHAEGQRGTSRDHAEGQRGTSHADGQHVTSQNHADGRNNTFRVCEDRQHRRSRDSGKDCRPTEQLHQNDSNTRPRYDEQSDYPEHGFHSESKYKRIDPERYPPRPNSRYESERSWDGEHEEAYLEHGRHLKGSVRHRPPERLWKEGYIKHSEVREDFCPPVRDHRQSDLLGDRSCVKETVTKHQYYSEHRDSIRQRRTLLGEAPRWDANKNDTNCHGRDYYEIETSRRRKPLLRPQYRQPYKHNHNPARIPETQLQRVRPRHLNPNQPQWWAQTRPLLSRKPAWQNDAIAPRPRPLLGPCAPNPRSRAPPRWR